MCTKRLKTSGAICKQFPGNYAKNLKNSNPRLSQECTIMKGNRNLNGHIKRTRGSAIRGR